MKKVGGYLVAGGLLTFFLFLGESYWNSYLVVAGSIAMLPFLVKIIKFGSRSWLLSLGLLLFLVGSIVNFSTSVNIPNTLDEITNFGFIYLLFILFIALRKDINHDWSQNLIILSALFLGGNSLFALFFPDYGEKIPGMNLVFASYGHNHLAAYLILVIPLVWAKLINARQKVQWLIVLAINYLVFWLCLGRTTMLIGLGQLLIIPKLIPESKTKYLLVKINQFLIFISAIFLIGYLIISFQKISLFCNGSGWWQKLCKPIDQEFRPIYWYQAWSVIKEAPLTGVGLGNFGLAVVKYLWLPGTKTAYAHQEFLQIWAELGLIWGSLLIGSLAWLLKKANDYRQANPQIINNFVFLAMISFFLNGFFDYDWQIIGLVIVVGYLLSISIDKSIFFSQRRFFSEKVGQVIWRGTILSYYLWLIFFVVTELAIASGYQQQVATTFPYFKWQTPLLLETNLSQNQKNKLWKIHNRNSKVILKLIDLTDQPQKNQLIAGYLPNDPWFQLFQFDYYDQQLAESNYDYLLDIFAQNVNFISFKGKQSRYQMDHQLKLQLGQQIFNLMADFFRQRRYQAAGKSLEILVQLDPWLLGDFFPSFLTNQNSIDTGQIDFFKYLNDVDGQYFGDQGDSYAQAALDLLVNQIEKRRTENLDLLVKIVLKTSPAQRWELWDRTLTTYSQNLTTSSQSNLELAGQDCSQLADFYQLGQLLTHDFNQEWSYSYRYQLAKLIMLVANQQSRNDLKHVASNYRLAQNLIPWIIAEEKVWYTDFSSLTTYQLDQIEAYALQLQRSDLNYQGQALINMVKFGAYSLIDLGEDNRACDLVNKLIEIGAQDKIDGILEKKCLMN